eukprot:TRINITY_DN30763_c0_g1_i3.p2 TRINITY_DN30763_c0_g1~~TRINITY_DN30763_c0_g1_i3.p2  ORF type:complete len:101 (-),score=5.24 TRINITY_DN30763_c0_g1_i3:142-444(-)
MWAGVPSEPLCLHTQSLATAQQYSQTAIEILKITPILGNQNIYFDVVYKKICARQLSSTCKKYNNHHTIIIQKIIYMLYVYSQTNENIELCKELKKLINN